MNTTDKIADYCQRHTTPQQAVLLELERTTFLHTLSPQMLSGAYQGRLLQFISQMIRPKCVLEIGTFTGYTAICLAQGLTHDGVLHTIEVNDELAYLIHQYIGKAGLEHQIVVHIGDAATVIPTIDTVFDLVFLDAGKLDYPTHYELALTKIRPGGFLVADNVLWENRIINMDDTDATVLALRTFNQSVQDDDRVENILLSLRDGLMLLRKKEM